jgi:hypothetical protein
VVCEWIGRSPAVAATHYLTVRECDFARAVGGAESGAEVVQKPVQPAAAAGGRQGTKKPEPMRASGSVYYPGR